MKYLLECSQMNKPVNSSVKNCSLKAKALRGGRVMASTLLLSGALLAPVMGVASTSAAVDWQPVASEKLIRMPARYMDASVERQFQKSSLASSINALTTQVQMEVARMQDLQGSLAQMEGQGSEEQRVELRHQVLTAKSNYLELMHEKHELAQRALNKKAALYQRVMKKLQHDKSLAKDPVSAAQIAKQQSARARLNQTASHVDQLLLQQLPGKSSKYQNEYGENLAKMEALKHAIQRHSANESPMLDGEAMSREQYVRYLRSGVDSELAILDQERLMLGYMAKLVAMDAQALEHEIAYGGPDDAATKVREQVRLVNTADMFINP